MYLLEWIGNKIVVERWKTILMIASSFILIGFIGIFFKGIQDNEANLKDIYHTLEVKMILSRRDNEGTLGLPAEDIKELEDSGLFRFHYYSSSFEYSIGGMDNNELIFEVQTETDTMNQLPMAENRMIGDGKGDLKRGECMIGISSPLFSVSGTSQAIRFSSGTNNIIQDFTIIDQYDGTDIYINYDQYIDICKELNIPVIIDAAEYIVKDAEHIEAVHAFLSDSKLLKVSRDGVYRDYTYRILDGAMNQSTAPLKRNISIMKGIFPFLFVLMIVLGFLLSYTVGRMERRTIYLMQSMGTPKYFQFFSLWAEQLLYCLAGGLPGLIFLPPRYVLLYLLCYSTGGVISIIRLLSLKGNPAGKE